MAVSPVQPLKAYLPSVMLSGRLMAVRAVQPLKASLPMVVTPLGMDIEESAEQPLNVEDGTSVIP